MGQYTVELTKEEEKALLTDMVSIFIWINTAIHHKASKCIDTICSQAIGDDTDTILTKDEKGQIAAKLEGKFFLSPSKLPSAIKAEIVSKARVKSAIEKNKELEDKMKP